MSQEQAFIRLTHHNEILLLPVHAAESHRSQTTLIENVPLTPHAFSLHAWLHEPIHPLMSHAPLIAVVPENYWPLQ
ncbi:hypothetical protein D9M71_840800 [compost metagenome]